MSLTNYQRLKGYRGKKKANFIVLNDAKKEKHILHGNRAINKQLPNPLRTPTLDYDLFADNPKASALQVEKKLDKAFKGDFYAVKSGKHKGTFRVISNVTNQEIADYTKPSKKISYKIIDGLKVADLNYFRKHILQTLKDPEAKFRHPKDRETLQRINLKFYVKKWLGRRIYRKFRRKGYSSRIAFKKTGFVLRRFN
jgi:hypothetical protein